MAMFTLPPPRRGYLRAFSLVQSAYSGVLVTVLAGAVGMRRHILLGIIVGFLMALSGLVWPQATAGFYRSWTRWAGNYGRWARGLLVRICYYFVLTPVASAGSTIKSDRKRNSTWTPRSTLSPLTYGSQYDRLFPGCNSSWIAAYYPGWAYKSTNLWALGLLPFLVVIAALDEEGKERYSGHIYTLF